ncbi:LytR family transcriptional regulator [Candidatus Parcubacteria bacterium]|nr:MAG: LytR family transcriptional regulator [Candidatus Parcubacteria bacterium]
MTAEYIDYNPNPRPEPEGFEEEKKKPFWKKIILYFFVLILSAAGFFLYDIFASSKNLSESLGQKSIWYQIKHLVSSEDRKLSGQESDRINILLLGIGGPNHDGPYLSDTIILASFKPSTQETALISIPRDFLAELPGFGWFKINHANAFAEAKNPGSGGKYTAGVIAGIFDLPIHYFAVIDFEGFIKIIDDLGGININVENTFDDYKYPVPGKENATTTEKYEHLHFNAGNQQMSGKTALKFARSRMAEGIEGSDFSRAKRQQQVIMAVKEKVFSWQTLVNPYKISNTLENIGEHVKTNMEVWEIYSFYQLTKDMTTHNVRHVILDDSENGFLVSDMASSGAYILRPRSGNYSQLRELAENIFLPQAVENALRKKNFPAEEDSNDTADFFIEIQNGTKINGLAANTSETLKNEGFKVIEIGNARTQEYQKTFIYDLSVRRNKKKILDSLATLLNASVSSTTPEYLKSSMAVNPLTDILVILGTDQNK